MYGKHHSEKTKKIWGEQRMGKGNSMYGKHHSEKTKKTLQQKTLKQFKNGVPIKTRKKLSLANSGEKNPNWQGGKSFEPYTKEFNNKFRRAIRKRDNQICMLCGIHREKLNRALDAHHINYDKKCNLPQNSISLCLKCHMKTNYNREHWIKFFQSLLAEKYDYKYSQNGEIILKLKEKNGRQKRI